MNITQLLQFSAIFLYFLILFLVAFLSYKKQHCSKEFIIGNRSMGVWLTALATHASDMSSWLFMGYPASIYQSGLQQIWAGAGLWLFMLLNWEIIAPKIRLATERYNSLTFSSFFESRLNDTSGTLRVLTALMLFAFYTIYISAALVSMGLVLNTLFHIPYHLGVSLGILIVAPYVFVGGFSTLAWIDLFQGCFLMCVISFVPLYVLSGVGGIAGIAKASAQKNISFAFFPDYKPTTLINTLLLTCGWGLGYFGQPHIITKFMGIRKAKDIRKAEAIGMTWMACALSAATLVGLVGIPFFQTIGLDNPDEVFIDIVKLSFSPFISGFILCAVFAAAINAVSSMVLVLSSSITEDLYRRLINPNAPEKTLLVVSKWSVLFVALVSYFIAVRKIQSIYTLVLFAWSGLASSFGPLLLLCLYSKYINKFAAFLGILVGGIIASVWPLVPQIGQLHIPALIPGFFTSLFLMLIVSRFTKKHAPSVNS